MTRFELLKKYVMNNAEKFVTPLSFNSCFTLKYKETELCYWNGGYSIFVCNEEIKSTQEELKKLFAYVTAKKEKAKQKQRQKKVADFFKKIGE